MRKQINMTEGPLFQSIIAYAIPIILTSVLQLLFNAADLIVVGQFCGANSVGAVGATNSLTSLLTVLFIGLSVGSGVTTAQATGAKNEGAVKRTVHTSVAVALTCGVIVSILGFFASKSLLHLMGTPDDIINLSAVYMKIYFSGAIFLLTYNFGAAILRAVGETQKPLLYLAVSGVLNVVLNIIFVTIFHMDVAGVALATMLSQALSSVLVIIELIRRRDACRLILKEVRFHKIETIKILKIGIPTGIQSTIFNISNVLIQSGVNSFGVAAVSGNAASASLEGFTYVSMNAFLQTSMNFTGQNIGARKPERVKRIFFLCTVLAAVVGFIIGATTYLFGRPLLSIYVGDDAAAIECGMIKLMWVALPYFICGIMESTTGILRGMGASIAPMLSAISGVCIFRIGWQLTVFRLPAFHSLTGLFMSYPMSWVTTGVANIIVYSVLIKKLTKKSG
ncbi:MAG: MATE family efflux transporter [Clostridia bacterium]|nr:MATE family efflux transporter [Clostridia bacterium]